jgi:hypothetical protein
MVLVADRLRILAGLVELMAVHALQPSRCARDGLLDPDWVEVLFVVEAQPAAILSHRVNRMALVPG